MHKNSIEFLRCVKCSGKVDVDILIETNEIFEGFLVCKNCKEKFPIINEIPIITNSFLYYIQSRPSLGGNLILLSKSKKMKNFVKHVLSKIKKDFNDLSIIEKRWEEIYLANKNSKFYSQIKQKISNLPKSNFVLEHGSSIGIMSKSLSCKYKNVFGIDLSFYAVSIAKKNSQKNTDFFVASSLLHPFGKKQFDVVLVLNMLELVEPTELLTIISKQVKHGYIVISDPYDYDRGKNSVINPLYENDIRKKIRNLGMLIVHGTNIPSLINWNLKINSRTILNYKVDLIIAKRS